VPKLLASGDHGRDGFLLSQGRKFMELSPGLAIMITVLVFNFLGDGLRDALDPHLRE